MQTVRLLEIAGLGLSGAIALTGCSQADLVKPIPAPEFAAGQGQPPNGTEAYAAGPYGINKGSVIANYQFVGLANEQLDHGASGMHIIQLADFYNPTGADVFPADSPYGAGEKKPKVLLIDVASVWCGPCNEEAQTMLPPKYADYSTRGGEFLLQLADGPTPGTPATPKNLYSWAEKYRVNFPATIDPSYQLGSLFQQDAFPANFIIDTKTMQIVDALSGEPPSSFWSHYETYLDAAN
jgi:hypothetical protein